MFILLLFIIVCCQRAVGLAGPFIAAVLEELKEVESERMHEGSEAAHREVQDVAEADDEGEADDVHSRNINPIDRKSQLVERVAKHTSGESERVETQVTQNVAEKSCDGVVGLVEA